ncbi:MAG: glutathione S-transferase [Mariprofundaceae bacterium]|nr:glutathione S-transferase [Mariprofundaceae bacterium]
MTPLPILYSFRRCPYAMRARMAIAYSGVHVELREVVLKNKPSELIEASPKATVPVLILPDGRVLDESRDIMQWALAQNDPDGWLNHQNNTLINMNDGGFKVALDHCKYAERFPEQSQAHYRSQGEVFLHHVEASLNKHQFIESHQLSITDIAIFPFIRQFAYVDMAWFEASSYVQLQGWLHHLLQSNLFLSVMKKYPAWQSSQSSRVWLS